MSCVKHLPDGRFVSGGMDGKLCLWNEIGARCVELGQGHSGSVAKVEVSHDGSVCVSVGIRQDCSVLVHEDEARDGVAGGSQGAGAGARVVVRRRPRVGRSRRPNVIWDASSGKNDAVGKRKACEGHVTALAWTRRVGYEAVMRGGDVLVSGGRTAW